MKTRYCDLHEKEFNRSEGCYDCLFDDFHATQAMVTTYKSRIKRLEEALCKIADPLLEPAKHQHPAAFYRKIAREALSCSDGATTLEG